MRNSVPRSISRASTVLKCQFNFAQWYRYGGFLINANCCFSNSNSCLAFEY